MRVLHVLHHSVPYLDGYCIRSKQIVDFQRNIGLDVRVLTSAQHEIEVGRPVHAPVESERIDGIQYHRTRLPLGALLRQGRQVPFVRELTMMWALGARLRRLVRAESIDVIHAHSPVLCGIPAAVVGAIAGVPVVYEVRGFWEDGFLQRWARGNRSIRYKVSRYLETLVFRRAAAVVGISQHTLDDIEARGIPREKLYRVPNAVDATVFVPGPTDAEVVARHGLENRPVVGFIGSFYQFEGLECLLDAMACVRQRLPEARLLLVGGGEQESILPQRVQELSLQSEVIIVGRVPHEQVARYYSVMDLLVYPRLRNRTTDLTTPLKPLEAMAMGKAVIGSDVGGIEELLDNGRVGTLFEAGNSRQLAERILALLTDDVLRERQAAAGREYVLRERAWDRLVLDYRRIYTALAGGSLRRVDE
jgi:PEP-CTERM/exosortase A-associated glycosyltransferase